MIDNEFTIQLVTKSPDQGRSTYFFLGFLNRGFIQRNSNHNTYTVDTSYFTINTLPYHLKHVTFRKLTDVVRMPYSTYFLDLEYEDGCKIFEELVSCQYAIKDANLISNNIVETFLDSLDGLDYENTKVVYEMIKTDYRFNHFRYLMQKDMLR